MDSNKSIKIIVISGPTASGKSDLAIRLAQKFNGEIISADSRQVYRGMDLGTGKVARDPILNDQLSISKKRIVNWDLKIGNYRSNGILHWMTDVASPKRQYSVAQWKRAAQKDIRDIVRRGKLPIICGGTGFWIDTLIYDLALPEIPPDPKLRARLSKLSPDTLYQQLLTLDPQRAANIDRHNPRRLIRALEIVLATGQPVPPKVNGSPYEPLILAIQIPKEKLAKRIEKRLDARLKSGMIQEVKKLHQSGVSYKRLESFGLEYRWLARYLQFRVKGRESIARKKSDQTISPERLTLDKARQHLLRDILHYSKRQLTWLRGNKDVVWLSKPNEAEGLVRRFLEQITLCEQSVMTRNQN